MTAEQQDAFRSWLHECPLEHVRALAPTWQPSTAHEVNGMPAMPPNRPSPRADGPRAIGYVRVSRIHQKLMGMGLEEQKDRIGRYFAYAVAGKAQWEGFLEDVHSATVQISQRPAGSQITALMQPGDHIIIAKLDRAFRDARDAFNTVAYWDTMGYVVHILDMNADLSTTIGRLLFGILAIIAEFETSRRRERIAETGRVRLAAGLFHNHPPVLWKAKMIDGAKRVVINEHHVEMAKKVVEWRNLGHSWNRIRKHLRALGAKNSQNRFWCGDTLQLVYKYMVWLEAKSQETGLPYSKILPPEIRFKPNR